MPRDNELMAVTGFRSTHALCTLVERLVDPAFLVQQTPEGLLSGYHFADLPILGIAQVDREWTMKFFRRRGSTVFLEAANQNYRPIHPQEELTIAAVVRAVIRKYA